MGTANKHLNAQAKKIAWSRKYWLKVAKDTYKLGLEHAMYIALFNLLLEEDKIIANPDISIFYLD